MTPDGPDDARECIRECDSGLVPPAMGGGGDGPLLQTRQSTGGTLRSPQRRALHRASAVRQQTPEVDIAPLADATSVPPAPLEDSRGVSPSQLANSRPRRNA